MATAVGEPRREELSEDAQEETGDRTSEASPRTATGADRTSGDY